MLNKTIFISFLISVLFLSSALADTATMTYQVPNLIVLDVPFEIDLNMVADNNVKNIKLYTESQDNLIFESSERSPTGWLAAIRDSQSRAIAPNLWFYSVGPFGSTFDAAGNKKVVTIKARIEGLDSNSQPNTGAVLLKTDPNNEVGIFPQRTFAIAGGQSVAINPRLSTCGDGVVGYADGNSNGREDTGEAREACDEGGLNADGSGDNRNANPGGCASACNYVELGYSCTNTAFGQRNSVCSRMEPVPLFMAKMNALLVNKVCYPSANDLNRLYLWYCDSDQNNDELSRSRVINGVLSALTGLLNELFP